MYEHRENASLAPGLSHNNPKTITIRVPAKESEALFACLVLEMPGVHAEAYVSRPWLLDLHDRIGHLLGRPTWRQVDALRLAAAHVLDNWSRGDLAGAVRDLNAALDDMP